ncbi:MAG: heme ABC exporter ATP-binding protein CcmA [Mangrovicoccus sp.]
MLAEIKDVACARGGIAVLEGVSFSVTAGEALILRGPNGVGKTTLLRCLAGLQPVLEGELNIPDGVAFAGHLDGIKATLTVRENLEFWSAVFGGPGADAAIETFDLAYLEHRPAMALSAGQKRRLGMSRLLVTGRKLWVMDEPTVSLDTEHVQQFARIVETHLQEGGAAIIATHIDLGLKGRVFDVAPYRAQPRSTASAFDEAFL